MSNILITGRPGIGKTTLIKKIFAELKGTAGGFYTEEIRQGRDRLGFKVKDPHGKEGILSHKNSTSNTRVGRYFVHVKGFEQIALPALQNALTDRTFIVVDEIGPMEECSQAFKQLLLDCLDSHKTVIATIKERGSAFVEKIKARPDAKVIHVDLENRTRLADEILKTLDNEAPGKDIQ